MSRTLSGIRNGVLLGTLVTLGLGALNVRIERDAGAIYNAVGGESRYYLWKRGDIFHAVKGQDQPLVMVHGLNAAASSHEFRKNFEPLSTEFRVYALDLLGFGLSDRPSLVYTGPLYVELLRDFLRDVVKEPAHIVASSLGAAYAIAVAARHPQLVRSLALICPSGVGNNDEPPSLADRLFLRVIRSPIYGTGIFNGIASRTGIRSFLRYQVFHNPELVTDDLVEYDYNTAHQHGAKWAPASFVTGHLNLNVRSDWERLTCPILLLWGREAKITPLQESEEYLRLNNRARLEVFDQAGLLPHDEQAERFNHIVAQTLRGLAAA